jgi:hypothetical protein
MFYFHVHGGDTIVRDQEGSELPDAVSALSNVRDIARGLAIEDLQQGLPVNDYRIEITDSHGLAVGTMRVREVLDGTG